MCTVQYSTCAGFMKTYVHIFWDLESVTNGASQPMLANSSCGVLTWHRIDVRKETRWCRVPHTTARTVLLVPEGPGGGRRGPAARSVRMRLFVRPRSHRLHLSVTLRRPGGVGQPPARLRGTMENASTGQMRSSNPPPACGAGCARVRRSRFGVWPHGKAHSGCGPSRN